MLKARRNRGSKRNLEKKFTVNKVIHSLPQLTKMRNTHQPLKTKVFMIGIKISYRGRKIISKKSRSKINLISDLKE
jgi:hypothetical protein